MAERIPIYLRTGKSTGDLNFTWSPGNTTNYSCVRNAALSSGYADLTATDSMWYDQRSIDESNRYLRRSCQVLVLCCSDEFDECAAGDLAERRAWNVINVGVVPREWRTFSINKHVFPLNRTFFAQPCRISSDGFSVSLNPYSWNSVANMLYIDQPIGVGFSHGDETVNGAKQAAKDVWQMLQIFLKNTSFSYLQSNEFGIWTEAVLLTFPKANSRYFLAQNQAIQKGSIQGITLNLKTLGIGNGLTDPLSQYPSYLTYSQSNPYKPTATSAQVAKSSTIRRNIKSIFCVFECIQRLQQYLPPLSQGIDQYDVRASANIFPPAIDGFLKNSTLLSQIGAETNFSSQSATVMAEFESTGDWMLNSAPDLASVITNGNHIRVLIYAGDADFLFNYIGVESMVANLTSKFNKNFNKTKFTNFLVDGVKAGQFKQSANFAYLRVYGAGEEVPAYGWQNLKPGQAALQLFNYTINDHHLSRGYSKNEIGVMGIWISLVVVIYCSMTAFGFVF
ncbi:alpha/beta-hydrolase [Sistotremastrum suecicum HHB10207 ss-3]|uniref:Alpha/beta-hydrolase n=1 Tax=Sistotremastrum suecicum HHB10207 ss-3 TaxID=1314776 RepID=A0A166C5N6_9AGAM|nr:alpha/beta-hydrolase [Sistotremastrum suecicum HHB10207 ss-3]